MQAQRAGHRSEPRPLRAVQRTAWCGLQSAEAQPAAGDRTPCAAQAKPVVVRLESSTDAPTMPPMAFWATYRDSAGTSPKHLIVADLSIRSGHLF